MADTVYRVRTVYDADTSAATRSVGGLASTFERATRAFDGAVIGTAIGVATAGVGLLAHGVTTLNAQAEEARLSIAGLFQAGTGGQGAEGFQQALGQTDEIIQRMRVHANALPGEFRDLQNVFQAGLLPGLGAGKTAAEIEQLSATFMAVTQSFHIESQNAGRELQMLLEGRAGSHIAMWSHLSGIVRMTAEQFNAMSRPERFDAISHALAGFQPMVDAYGNTWAAAESTAKDHLSQLLRVGTAPLFDRAKDALNQLNHWFEANQQSLERWAVLIGTRIANGFDFIVDKAHQLFDMVSHLDLSRVLEQVQHFGGGILAARAGLGLLSSSGAMGAVGSLAGGGALAGMGIAGLVIAPIVAAFATGAVDFGDVMHSLGSSVAPVVQGLGGLASAFVPLLAAIGAPLIEAFTGLVALIAPLAAGLLNLTAAIARGARRLVSGAGDFIESLASDDERGHTDAEERQRDRLLRLNAPIPEMDRDTHQALLAQSILDGGLQFDRPFQEWMPQVADSRATAGLLTSMLRAPTTAAAQANHAAAPTPTTNMNVHVRFEATIENQSDSDRVVTDIHDAVRNAVFHPVESPTVPVLRGG